MSRRIELYIAVGRYRDADVTPIPFCENDIESLAAAFLDVPYIANASPFQKVITTRAGLDCCGKMAILMAVEECAAAASADDLLLLAYSGHGASLGGTTYLVPADAQLSDPDSFIPIDWLRELLDNTAAKFKIILIDACHAGVRDLRMKYGAMRLQFDVRVPAMQRLLLSSRGVAYATACTSEEKAFAQRDGTHSIWMAAVADAIRTARGPLIRVDEILLAAAEVTTAQALAEWGQPQTPYTLLKCEGILPLGCKPAPPSFGPLWDND